MAGSAFTLDWSGLDRIVGHATSAAGASRAAMQEIGEALVSSTVERFSTSTAPDGTSWEPSARATRDGGKTLVDSGRLRASIGYEASSQHVAVGSNVVYARIHQEGGEAGRNHAVTLPERPYLGISDEDIKEARAILHDHLVTALRGGR